MSHSLAKVNIGNNAVAIVTIVNYAVGGEAFTLAELGITALHDVAFILTATAGVTLIPQYAGGGMVKLVSPSTHAGALGEIPATTALNFTFCALVMGS
jgi:hypothetical protein